MPLPPEVLRQMGFIPRLQAPMGTAPPPIGPIDASLPGSPDFQDQQGLMPHLVPQTDAAITPRLPSYGAPFPPGAPESEFAPPPPAAPPTQQPPPAPQQPADQGRAPAAAAPQLPSAPTITRPSSAAELSQRAEQQQLDANQAGRQGVVDETAALRARSSEELKAYDASSARAAQIGQQLKADEDKLQKTVAEKQAYLADRKKAVDDYQIDRNKHWNSLGLGKKIGWAIAIAMSELGRSMSARAGNQVTPINPVLAMLQAKGEEAIQTQLDGYEKVKGRAAGAQHALDGVYAQLKDRRAVAAAMRAENDQMLANEIKHAIAKTADPVIRANGVKEIAKLEASAAKNAQEAADQAAKVEYQGQQLAVDRARLGETQRSNLADEKERNRHNLATEENQRIERENAAKKLEREGKNDQAKLVRDRAFGGESKLTEVDPKNVAPGDKVVTINGKTYVASVGLITNKAGEVWIPNGEVSVIAEAQKKYSSANRLGEAIRRMLDLGPEYLTDVRNSDKLQELKQEMASARLETLQAKGMGAPQSKDIEYAENFIGTTDPTRWKDSKAGLERALKTLQSEQNATFRALGLDKEWKAPWATESAKAEPTRIEKLEAQVRSKDALERPFESPQDLHGRIVADRIRGGATPDDAKRQAQFEVALRERGATQPDQQGVTAVKQLAQLAKQGGDEGQSALASLQSIIAARDAEFKASRAAPPTIGPMINWAKYYEWKNAKLADDPIYAAAKAAIADITGAKQAPARAPRDLSYPVPQYDPNGYDGRALVDRFQQTPQPTFAPETR